jgi:hypothetical protein
MRAVWNDIATVLGNVRARLRRSRRSDRLLRAQGVELAARAICSTLRKRSTRFDSKRFMRIALR